MKILRNGTRYILCTYFVKEKILESIMRMYFFPFNQISVFSSFLESDKKRNRFQAMKVRDVKAFRKGKAIFQS